MVKLWRQPEEGLLLIATGKKHRREAQEALPRLRPYLSGRQIWLVCDDPQAMEKVGFDRVLPHSQPRYSYRDKIPPLLQLPFKRTLFVDTDIQLLYPIDDIFDLLKIVDVVGCHAPVRWCQWQDNAVPEGFCELNSGVLGLRRGYRQRRLMQQWIRTYDDVNVAFDQASLRSALWWSTCRGLRTWVLPPEYNLRTTKPWLTGRGLAVKIVHGRIPNDMRQPLERYLNGGKHGFRASNQFPTHQNESVEPRSKEPSKHIFILGAGRSGTSLVAGLFRRAGVFMGEFLYQPRKANPLGFFEDREVNDINEELLSDLSGHAFSNGQRWLAEVQLDADFSPSRELQERIRRLLSRVPLCFKDPRFCYTLSAWREQLSEAERQHACFICVFRNPSVVVTSMLRELHEAAYLQELSLTSDQLLQAWELQYCHVLQHHSKEGRWLFVDYDSLFDSKALDVLADFTGLEIDRSFVKPELRRTSAEIPIKQSSESIYHQLLDMAAKS